MEHVTFVPANFDETSTRTPRDRFLEDQSEIGEFRARRASRSILWDFNLVWKYRPLEDVQNVEAFWDRTHEQPFTFSWLDSATYLGRFLSAPQSKAIAYGFYEIRLDIVGRKQ